MLGRSEFALRQGFALWAKLLYGASAAPPLAGAWAGKARVM